MQLASRKDRQQIGSLRDMPLSDSNRPFWDNPPIAIVPPSNEPRRRTRAEDHNSRMPSTNSRNQDAYNPLKLSRTKTTLTSATALGKRTSVLDFRSPRTTSPPACTRKKVRVDTKKNQILGSEIIDIEAERRDTSSPDPLNDFEPWHEGRRSFHKNGRIVGDPKSSSSDTAASASRLPPDGPATKDLQRALEDERVSSPIEDFEGDVVEQPFGHEPPPGKVRHMVSQIEKRKSEDTQTPPKIDLKTKVKSKMKPKNLLDHVATSSSNFTRRGRSLNLTEDFSLPIRACVIGNKLISKDSGTEPVLAWKAIKSALSILCKPDKAVVTLDTGGMDYIEYTRSTTPSPDFDGMPVLRIHMEGIHSMSRMRQSSGSTSVTVMLDSSTEKWHTSFYDSLINWLNGQRVATQLSRNGQQMWEMAMRDSNASDQDQDQDPVYTREDMGRPISQLSDVRPVSEAKSESNKGPEDPSAGKSDTVSDRPFHPRRSARNVAVTIKKPKLALDPDEVILVYPQGLPGAINITNADVSRLQPGEFLNDTVIEFGLKLWHRELESLKPEFAKDVHVFSSFFYKKLNKKNFEEGYQSVRKWTSKINLFEKKYIIIPINEHLHWYLAIIHMPQYILQPPATLIKPVPAPRTRSRTSKAANEESPKFSANDSLSSATSSVAEAEDQPRNDPNEFRRSCTTTITEDQPISDAMDIVPEGDNRPPQPTDECAMDVDKSEEDAVREQLRANSILSELEIDDGPSNVGDMEVEVGIPTEQVPSRFFSHDVKRSIVALDSQSQQNSEAAAFGSVRQQESIIQGEELDDQALENDDEQGDESGSSLRTYIFILDSLGTRHLQATRQLNKYLKMEASHKLNISNTSDAVLKNVPVPTQPNFCDCGIYLLHFAQTFMTDPTKYFQTINASKKSLPANDRKAIWKDHKVGTMRQELTERIKQLSEEWKKTRQEAKKDQAETVFDSDSEIEYVETAPAPGQTKAKTPRNDGRKCKAEKSSRLRG